jgi:peptidoglycan L-alanyl-D-glutamate endopeptidase CwlK
MVLNPRSEKNLAGVHPKLVSVVRRAADVSDIEFMVIEGLRTIERQKQLVAKGASKTMNSKHITGHAVDLAPMVDGEIRWDWPLFHKLAPIIKQAAKDMGVNIVWGGDWRSFADGPHWEIDPAVYK